MGAANDSASRFCPPITFLSPDNGGTEGGAKTIEETRNPFRHFRGEACYGRSQSMGNWSWHTFLILYRP